MSGRRPGTNGPGNYQRRGLDADAPVIPTPWIHYHPYLKVMQMKCRTCGSYATFVTETHEGDRCQACPQPKGARA